VGKAIAKVVEARGERVAVLASGGMSHYPGTWKYFQPEHAFDRWLVQELEEGRTDSLLDLTGEQLDEVGNTELLTWIVALGASPAKQGELLSYQPTSHHGHGVMRFLPNKRREPHRHVDMPEYGGYVFKGRGYEFYKHPTAETYPLNKALAILKRDAGLRARFVRDMDGVSAELGLTPEQTAAVKTFSTARVVEQGAHGILALSTMLAVQGAARDAGIKVDSVA